MMDFEVALDQFEIFILILMRMASFIYFGLQLTGQ